MASFVTNRGATRLAELATGDAMQTNLYLALVTDTPTRATNTLGELTEIAAGNGYTAGGFELDPTTDITVTENDSANRAEVEIADDLVEWTASSGPIPASGDGARWAVLTDDHATVGSREVWACFDLASARSVEDGFPITINGLVIRLNTAS